MIEWQYKEDRPIVGATFGEKMKLAKGPSDWSLFHGDKFLVWLTVAEIAELAEICTKITEQNNASV